MKAIPRDVKRITYSTEIRNLKHIPFTDLQKAVILGNILGDGCLCENWSKTNYRMIISHCVSQKEYIYWKYEILKNYILTEPRLNPKAQSFTIRTISHPDLSKFREMFYVNKKKIIPKNIKDILSNPLVLAVWFMDDGNKVVSNNKIRGYHLNTQSFTYDENEQLATILKELYSIETEIEKNKDKFRLAIRKTASRNNLREKIESFILPSMKYKISV